VADGLDVVTIRVAHEGSEVVRVILRPQPRAVQDLRPGRHRGVEECLDGAAVGSDEREVGLAEAFAALSGPIQNVGFPETPKPMTSPKSITRCAPRGASTES